MTSTKQIAKHLRKVYFGGNWTSANLKDMRVVLKATPSTNLFR
jgi:hypothetical protein